MSRENDFIEYIESRLNNDYLGDDCAQIGDNYIISSDSQVENVHFSLKYFKPYEIGSRLVLVNVSDIVACGGVARYLQVMINYPKRLSDDFFKQLYQGIVDTTRRFNIDITGGNISESENDLILNASIIGLKNKSGIIGRSIKNSDYDLVVSGFCGLSYTGLKSLSANRTQMAKIACSRHIEPIPRIGLMMHLVENLGSNFVAIDTSDSIFDSVKILYKMTKFGLLLDIDLLPIHDETIMLAHKLELNPYAIGLYGGEDYEILACLPKDYYLEVNRNMADRQIKLTKIGCVLPNKELYFKNIASVETYQDKILFEHLK